MEDAARCGLAYFCAFSIFAHVSRSVTVRLKTELAGLD